MESDGWMGGHGVCTTAAGSGLREPMRAPESAVPSTAPHDHLPPRAVTRGGPLARSLSRVAFGVESCRAVQAADPRQALYDPRADSGTLLLGHLSLTLLLLAHLTVTLALILMLLDPALSLGYGFVR